MTFRNRALRIYTTVAEAVPALLLSAMFLSFILQVFMRYVIGQPVGWTVEVCAIAWIWIILWGQSVSARDEDEIRFDIVYSAVGAGTRRVFRILAALLLITVYLIAFGDSWSYVSFMKIEDTSYLDIPYNYVFAIFLVFLAVSILRYALIAVQELRGVIAPPANTSLPEDTPE
ncbi:Tripartite ATP-independent periplasmic transporters, DctQ component [Aquimixticola soesokkakensis]|uniref:TRAP transporter small permease protein n=1 Tax=Aquimixticola soesokkakensis TaxID=1519096 RepID=A0A1Y5TGV0_9RHOB|nr:TRAP transporter small permease subunit [Aquimixticola soesokkakensis]SLN63725.1 Tripartite ATP-independent periplasmic transporters, DctQ component [Aquimixticola soesokkakensis]